MKTTMELLRQHPQVSDFKINIRQKESYELFFVKGRLETVRCTDTCDKEVTVYAAHGEYLGDSKFFIYPSTTTEQLVQLIDEAATKALLLNNQSYTLPQAQEGDYVVESNFAHYQPAQLAEAVAQAVFEANRVENAGLNSVEIFINKYHDTVLNSRGLRKTQVKYDAMVETIPTYNGEKESVELYQQVNFSSLDREALVSEVAGKLAEVKARYEAVKPQQPLSCPVVLHKQELGELFSTIAYDLNYSSVYHHSNLFKKGDAVQTEPTGDKLTLSMAGQVPGSVLSSSFDGDGMSLGEITLVENGVAVNYYGSNQFGQYLGEEPTGALRCLVVQPGSLGRDLPGEYLEVLSMSGLQVDLFSDYIGGEVRLAYWHRDGAVTPVTGISISGSLRQTLSALRLSDTCALSDGYFGPHQALLSGMQIF